MRLSDRLERIAATAAAVTEGYVADVGTDHGYVPIELAQRRIMDSSRSVLWRVET